MHTIRNAPAPLSALCLAAAAALSDTAPSPVPLRWTSDAARPAPYVAQVFRGETVGLACSLTAYARPLDLAGATAELCWQTNGMGSAWWTAPASVASNAVSAVWTPEMDCGAASYDFFLRVAAPGGVTYRAHGAIAMRGSPGASPNELPPPVQRIDFAAVSYTNAPWALPEDIPPAPDLTPYATTGYVATAIAAIPEPDLSGYATTNDLAAKLDSSGGTMTGPLVMYGGDTKLSIQSDGFVFHNPSDRWFIDFPAADGIIALRDDIAAATNGLARAADIPTVPSQWPASAITNAPWLTAESDPVATAALAAKQDALPYPTNAIPYAAIANAPWLSAETDPVATAALAALPRQTWIFTLTNGVVITNLVYTEPAP